MTCFSEAGRTLAVALLVIAPLAHAIPQPAPPLRPLVEELRIDGKLHEWKAIESMRMGPAGHLLVKEELGKSLRVFSPTGALVRTLGQRGQGPGEFINVDGFGLLGDTIWVSDGASVRITYFDLSGKLLGTLRADSGVMPMRDSAGRVVQVARMQSKGAVALHGDGTALVIPLMFPGDADTLGVTKMYPWWLTTRRGQVLDTVLTVALESQLVRITSADGTRRNFLWNPLPQRQTAAASVGGRRLALIDASYTGRDAWTYTVRVSDQLGRTLYTRRFPFSRAPIPARVVDSVGTELVARYRNYVRVRESLFVPASYPPVTRALVAKDGSVWLRGRDEPGGAMWTVLDPTGNPTALVREPARTRFIELDDGLWAVERDDDDVESIVRYRLDSR